jgi:hypothetical protein
MTSVAIFKNLDHRLFVHCLQKGRAATYVHTDWHALGEALKVRMAVPSLACNQPIALICMRGSTNRCDSGCVSARTCHGALVKPRFPASHVSCSSSRLNSIIIPSTCISVLGDSRPAS